ncbi:MAG: lipid A deacylase LpxR family protein, partial [Magnetovibrio sp.]|nr:lipid A deacylase LpxR family protein [Magnetovibrio sp.]
TARADAVLLQIDNDKVVDTDRHYTNGMRFAYTPTPPPQSKPTKFHTAGLWVANLTQFKATDDLQTGWAVGQEMYTPENVDTTTPDPQDRPYAGWTYLGITTQNTSSADTGDSISFLGGYDLQDTFELDIGIIGPKSKAAQLQNAVHRLINVSVSRGWRSQVGHEIGILSTRILKLRTKSKKLYGLQRDAIAHSTIHLGNVKTAISGGVTFRLGENLKEDFGPVYGTFSLPHQAPKAWTWSTFAGFEARAVVRDIFLDGNTFKKSPDVKKNPFVLESRLGITTHVPFDNASITAVRLSLTMVHRTREYQTQGKADRYGSLQATVNF